MKEALEQLSQQQIDFICRECSITLEQLQDMGDDELYNTVYEPMCNIEIDEVCASETEEETERCQIASDIVTILGNALAEQEGFLNEEEE